MWNADNDPQEYPETEPDARAILVEALEDGHHALGCPVEYDNSCHPDESVCTCWVGRARKFIGPDPEVPLYAP